MSRAGRSPSHAGAVGASTETREGQRRGMRIARVFTAGVSGPLAVSDTPDVRRSGSWRSTETTNGDCKRQGRIDPGLYSSLSELREPLRPSEVTVNSSEVTLLAISRRVTVRRAQISSGTVFWRPLQPVAKASARQTSSIFAGLRLPM